MNGTQTVIQEIFSHSIPLKCNNWIRRRIVMQGGSEQIQRCATTARVMKFLLRKKSESLFVWNVSSCKWQNSLWFSASSTGRHHWLSKREGMPPWEVRLTLCYSLSRAFSYVHLRIFANDRETGLHCNVPFPWFCIGKFMWCPVAARGIFLVPAEETTFRILPVCFQRDAGLMLIFRDKYLFGATLFIYPVLFFFLDQREQTTSSFPCWEMMVGLFSKFSVQRNFWVLVSTQGHHFFFFFSVWFLSPYFHSLLDF